MRTFTGGHSKEALFDAALKAVGSIGHEVLDVHREERLYFDFDTGGESGAAPAGTKLFLYVLESQGVSVVCVARRGRFGFGDKKALPVAEEIWKAMDVILG